MYLELFSREHFLLHHFSKSLILMKSIQEHLRQLLQSVPAVTSLHRCAFEQFKQRANKASPRCQSKLPNSFTKAMDGLFK